MTMTTADNPMPQTAMVLAAGLGTRMRPLTDKRPKPLIEVAGKALIDYALDQFAEAGVARAVVNVHYFADMLEAHVRRRKNPEIIVSDERAALLETGGGLARARGVLGAAPIFCTNTDAILVDGPQCGPQRSPSSPCARLAEGFDPDAMDALLLLVPRSQAHGYDGPGDFHLDADGRLEWVNRDERDANKTGGGAPLVFTGLQILSPALLDGAPDGAFSTRLLWEKAKAKGRFFGVVHDGPWMHVGDPEGLAEAEAFFRDR